MQDVKASDTHNFALIGHSGDGKTSLGEALLHQAGAIAEPGRVTEGTSVLNHLPEEQARHTTISSTIYSFDRAGKHFSLVDTPGDSNFQADGEIALAALDGAVLVLSATDGPKVGSSRMLKSARAHNIPVIAFVNGVDREQADFKATVDALEAMALNPAQLTLPIPGAGVIDLLTLEAYGPDGRFAVPSDHQETAESAREHLIEAIAESDDTLLERYLEEGTLSDHDIERGLLAGARAGTLLPIFAGSALLEQGIERLLWGVSHLLPSAADRAPYFDVENNPVDSDPDAPFVGIVLKTIIDRYAGTLSVFRVVAGTLRPDTAILDATSGTKERVSKLFLLRGAAHQEVPEAGPGDIVAAAKLKSVQTGHALTAEKGGTALPPLDLPEGVISYAISAKSKGEEDKVFASLGRLVQEDPTLTLGRDPATGEFLLTGRGELHIRTTAQKLQRMFGVEVELETPKIPYRETIQQRVEHVEGKLKKQSGGKGMYGVCNLTLEPRERGEGIEFVDEVVGGAIPRNLIPAVAKGILEACEAGPLAGFPVVDIRARCTDGKHHSVDSNEMAFKLAGSFAFRAGMEQARPMLLEPIMQVHVTVPENHIGDVMGDLSSRRGRVGGSVAQGHYQVIDALVPMSELLEYANALTSLTGGEGEFHLEFSHYDQAPAQVQNKVIAESKAAQQPHH